MHLEMEAVITADASSIHAMPPPPRPQLGQRQRRGERAPDAPSHAHSSRFRARTDQVRVALMTTDDH